MLNTNHPLVGKQIVEQNPQAGEVTKNLINSTLGTVSYEEPNSFALVQPRRNSWTIIVTGDRKIVGVHRH